MKLLRYQLIFTLVICLTVRVSKSLNGLKSEDIDDDPDSDMFEKYIREDERDAHIVIHSIKRLIVRPDYDKYPYVIKLNTSLTDEVDRDKNEIMINYLSPKAFPKDKESDQGDAGPILQEVTIKTNYIDMNKDIIVLPLGERGIGYPVKGVYVVFRRSSDKMKHFMNLAYIRRTFKVYSVEWSILDASMFGRSRIDQEFCRRGKCDIFHHMLGTCEIASHKCDQPLKGPPHIINKFTYQTNTGPEQEAASDNPMTVTLNLTPGGSPTELKLSVGKQNKASGGDGGGWGDGGQSSKKRDTDTDDSEKAEEEEKHHIPNSLDLLMLKREDPSTLNATVSEAHFENVLVATRSVATPKPAMLDCVGCERYGEFFNDFEEDPDFARLIGETVPQLRSDLDWDITTGMENEAFIKENPGIPYVGYGHCNRSDITDNPGNYTKEVEELGKFFLASLRLNCDQHSENRVRSMFTSRYKLLEIQDDYSVGVAHSSVVLKFKILTVEEFKTLMTGAFMAKYIKLYRQEQQRWRTNNPEILPMDEKISRNIRFFSKLILSVMDSFSKLLSQHFVRGHRFILRILRDKFNVVLVKIAGDKGSTLKETWINDLYRLMALKEFILFGMGPLSKSGTKADVAFTSFATENEKRIKRLVQAYGVVD